LAWSVYDGFAETGIIPEIVTAGLDTVGVRVSVHPVFLEIIRALGKPLAAPSANRFGRISPTNAQHVLDDLKDQIPLDYRRWSDRSWNRIDHRGDLRRRDSDPPPRPDYGGTIIGIWQG
jgi:Putative translation factor (SUA5)